MTQILKVVVFNFMILLAYAVILQLTMNGDELGALIIGLVLVAVQIGVNIILAIIFFIKKKHAYARAFLLFGIVTLMIGFSFCYGTW